MITSSLLVPNNCATSSVPPTSDLPVTLPFSILEAPATAPPTGPLPPVIFEPFTITAPATFITAPPAIVNICNTDDISSAICVATFNVTSLPNQSIALTTAPPRSRISSGKS